MKKGKMLKIKLWSIIILVSSNLIITLTGINNGVYSNNFYFLVLVQIMAIVLSLICIFKGKKELSLQFHKNI